MQSYKNISATRWQQHHFLKFRVNLHSAVLYMCNFLNVFISPTFVGTHITIGTTPSIESKQTACVFKISDT